MARSPTKPQRTIASFFRPGGKQVAAEDEVEVEAVEKEANGGRREDENANKDGMEDTKANGNEAKDEQRTVQVDEDRLDDEMDRRELLPERTSRKVSERNGRFERKHVDVAGRNEADTCHLLQTCMRTEEGQGAGT